MSENALTKIMRSLSGLSEAASKSRRAARAFPESNRGLRALKRFGRDRKGVAAVEFGLVALPFFTLMLALVEVTLIGLAQTSLDMAVSDAARRIRVGDVQAEGLTQNDIRNEICTEMTWILSLDCDSKLYLDVQNFTSYVAVNNPDPFASGDFDPSGFAFSPGSRSDIVLVRTYYEWSTITPFFGQIFGNTSGGARILASSIMFRNEPFPAP